MTDKNRPLLTQLSRLEEALRSKVWAAQSVLHNLRACILDDVPKEKVLSLLVEAEGYLTEVTGR